MLLVADRFNEEASIDLDPETFTEECLFELVKCDPNQVTSYLAEDGMVLDQIQE